ncbi:MAG: tryptophanase [Deltaproteobacteria bacterium]|nr:tryptophanase [Deltaproteobacteria bacterium]
MEGDFKGIPFSVPYEIAVVRSLKQTTLREREEALKRAYYNTELIPQEMVYVDLKTDSSVSSVSTRQVATAIGVNVLEAGAELAPEASAGMGSLSRQFEEIFDYPFMVPCTRGRAAERIWAKIHVREGAIVPGNILFPSTRFHIESNGAKVADVISEKAYDLFSDDPFKGNVDIEKLKAVIEEHGQEKIPCVYVELCVNSCGGHPVSLGNLEEVAAVLRPQRIPLFLDASRILENSYFIQRREKGYQRRSITEIIRETCSCADGCTLSALKNFSVREGGFIGMRDEKSYQKAYLQTFLDGSQPSSAALEALNVSLQEIFRNDQYVASRVEQVEYLWHALVGWQRLPEKGVPLLRPSGGHGVFIDVKEFLPHVSPENHRAESLAAFIYSISGVRITKGPPLAQNQTARGIELLRLAVPARRYLRAHMDDVVEAVLYSFSHKDEIKGLKRIERPGRSKYDPPHFEPVEA